MFIARCLPSTSARRLGKNVCLAFVWPLSMCRSSSGNSLNRATVVSPPVFGRCAHTNLSPITIRSLAFPPECGPTISGTAPSRQSAARALDAGQLAEELREGADLARVERREHVLSGANRHLARAAQRAPALGREVHGPLAAVGRMRAPLRESPLLELVYDGHHRAGVYHRSLHQILLRAAWVRVDQRENAEVRRTQAQRLQRRGEIPCDPLPVPGEQEARRAGQGLGWRVFEPHLSLYGNPTLCKSFVI